MPFTFREGRRDSLSLLIGLAGGTGSGKTFSAMRLAVGLSGGKKFAVVDTENGRANFYADYFKFDHGNLFAPFRPKAYVEAIQAADKAGYPVIVVDSASHEWDGDGGVLEWHEELLAEFVRRSKAGGDTRPDYQIEESNSQRAWIEPKGSLSGHKFLMSRLLQVRAHVILCFRAEPKTEIAKEKTESGKMKTVFREKRGLTGLDGWFPICEKKMPFEMTTYLLFTAENPGVPKPITLREPHKPFFPLDKPITEEAGRQLAAWARGGTTSAAPNPGQDVARDGDALPSDAVVVSKDKYDDMFAWLSESPERMKAGRDVLKRLGYANFKQVKVGDLKTIYDCEKETAKI